MDLLGVSLKCVDYFADDEDAGTGLFHSESNYYIHSEKAHIGDVN
jgi:hypothetical protein